MGRLIRDQQMMWRRLAEMETRCVDFLSKSMTVVFVKSQADIDFINYLAFWEDYKLPEHFYKLSDKAEENIYLVSAEVNESYSSLALNVEATPLKAFLQEVESDVANVSKTVHDCITNPRKVESNG